MNISAFVGFISGVCIGVLLIWALMRRLNTDGKRKTEYDERQKAVRGQGYMYAFYCLAVWTCILMAVEILGARLPATRTVMFFTGIMISGLVLAWYCIMNDAYWGLNTNIRYYIRFMIGIGAINLISGFLGMARGQIVVDGVLQNDFISFEAGILIVGIGLLLLIKSRKDSREESEQQR